MAFGSTAISSGSSQLAGNLNEPRRTVGLCGSTQNTLKRSSSVIYKRPPEPACASNAKPVGSRVKLNKLYPTELLPSGFIKNRSEERRVGKECKKRGSP